MFAFVWLHLFLFLSPTRSLSAPLAAPSGEFLWSKVVKRVSRRHPPCGTGTTGTTGILDSSGSAGIAVLAKGIRFGVGIDLGTRPFDKHLAPPPWFFVASSPATASLFHSPPSPRNHHLFPFLSPLKRRLRVVIKPARAHLADRWKARERWNRKQVDGEGGRVDKARKEIFLNSNSTLYF